MEVCFVKTPTDANGPFTSYLYQENLSTHPSYADIRAIAQANTEKWLNDLTASHGELSTAFLKHGPWWWLSPYSRLDARNWGQEETIKPLFFARAILEWGQRNPQTPLSLIGTPVEVAVFLRDFDPSVRIKGVNSGQQFFHGIFKLIAQKFIFKMKLLKQWGQLCRICLRGRKQQLQARCLVLCERFDPTHTSLQARDYFFARMFDVTVLKSLKFACIDQLSFGPCSLEEYAQTFFVLDQATWGDAFFALWRNICFDGSMFTIGVNPPACVIAGKASKKFWRYYLWANYRKGEILKELCVYRIFKRLASNKRFESIVYPYEEKGYERALLGALRGQPVKTIGYTPHPQHRLAVCLKDSPKPAPLRPSLYGVCGREYIDYFEKWAGKPAGITHVWGSAKSAAGGYAGKPLPKNLKVFLLVSHPFELEVFASWLKAEAGLCRDVSYLIRTYKSEPTSMFAKRLRGLLNEFPFMREAEGDFASGLAQCDVAMFNATSAGLLAINGGKITIHAALDDFFMINPCFDHLGSMLSCTTAAALAQRFQELRAMGPGPLEGIWQNQKDFVAGVFAPIDRRVIEQDLFMV